MTRRARTRRWGAGLSISCALVLGCTEDLAPVASDTDASSDVGLGGPAEPLPDPEACAEPVVGPRRLRRLSHDEYGNTVRVLVADDLTPEAAFALDELVDGFENDATALTVTPLLASQYRVAAEDLAAVVRDTLPTRLPCASLPNQSAAQVRACATEFVDEFGTRAFRRPLTDTERTRYLDLWQPIADAHGLDDGLFWVAAAMLQSPNFLYRSELGTFDEARGVYVLTPYEVAAQLSYLITAGPPDAELLAAAAAGDFYDPDDREVLVEHAERLLASEQGGRAYADFSESWLGVRRPRVAPDPETHFQLNETLRRDMKGEFRRRAAAAMREGLRFDEWLNSDATYVTDELARYYDMPHVLTEIGDPEGFVEATLPEKRRGLLASGQVLTVYANPATSAPVQRGKMVRERLLCEKLPKPPPNIDVSPLPPDDEWTTRERHAQHTNNPACYDCHKYMDPIGFGFEHFDGIARWRDIENDKPIDATGEIIAGPRGIEGTFDGLDELQELLASDPAVQACYVERWSQFAVGIPDDEVACLRDDLVEDFQAEQGRLNAPLLGLLRSRWFLERE